MIRSVSSLTRRGVLRLGLAAAAACARPRAPRRARGGLWVTLVPRRGASGRQIASFGLPLPSGLIDDPRRVAIAAEDGRPIEASVRTLEPWRPPRSGARSVLVQLVIDVGPGRPRRVYVSFDRAPRDVIEPLAAIPDTLVTADGLAGPRVLALLPARWMCASGLVGPQVSAEDAGLHAAYDDYVERSFTGSLVCLTSDQFADWLYDRPTCWYTYTRAPGRRSTPRRPIGRRASCARTPG